MEHETCPLTPGLALARTTFALVQRLRAGDRSAEKTLLCRYVPRIRQIVALRLGRPARDLAARDDAVGDALLRGFRGEAAALEPRPEGAFLDRVAVCVASDLRENGAAPPSGSSAGSNPGSRAWGPLAELASFEEGPPARGLVGEELAGRVEDALLRMDPRKRELIVLRKLCGLGYDEIAARLGIPATDTVRVYLCRALRDLEQRIPD